MKPKGKTRKQEIAEFFVTQGLFMPSSTTAREAIYFFVRNGNGYGLGGATPGERIACLKQVTAELRGRRMRNKKAENKRVILEVRYILPKTTNELTQQIIGRAGDRKGMERQDISPFKVCVVSPALSQPCVIPLDMLVLVGEERSSQCTE